MGRDKHITAAIIVAYAQCPRRTCHMANVSFFTAVHRRRIRPDFEATTFDVRTFVC